MLKDWTLKNPRIFSLFVYASTIAMIIALIVVAIEIHKYGELLNKSPCELCIKNGNWCFGNITGWK